MLLQRLIPESTSRPHSKCSSAAETPDLHLGTSTTMSIWRGDYKLKNKGRRILSRQLSETLMTRTKLSSESNTDVDAIQILELQDALDPREHQHQQKETRERTGSSKPTSSTPRLPRLVPRCSAKLVPFGHLPRLKHRKRWMSVIALRLLNAAQRLRTLAANVIVHADGVDPQQPLLATRSGRASQVDD